MPRPRLDPEKTWQTKEVTSARVVERSMPGIVTKSDSYEANAPVAVMLKFLPDGLYHIHNSVQSCNDTRLFAPHSSANVYKTQQLQHQTQS